jgi:serine/threonine protein kinase
MSSFFFLFLFFFFCSVDVAISEWEMSRILRSVALALQLIHSKQRIHRDIKSDNILFGARDEVKLADFGFATKLTEETQARYPSSFI